LRTVDDIPLDANDDQLSRIGKPPKKAKVAIATLWVSEPLQSNPLNSPFAALRAKGAWRAFVRIPLDDREEGGGVAPCSFILAACDSGARFRRFGLST